MWYETKESVKEVKDGVMDIQYMDKLNIERENLKTGKRTVLVEGLTGEDLVQEVTDGEILQTQRVNNEY